MPRRAAQSDVPADAPIGEFTQPSELSPEAEPDAEPEVSAEEDSGASSLVSAITGVAHAAVAPITTVMEGAEHLATGAQHLASGARRAVTERPPRPETVARRMAKQPLSLLWEVYPGATAAARRQLGLETVPVDRIRGTAVAGSQRGGDFLPISRLRGANWQGRWQRILNAIDDLTILPPVDLLRTGDEYWVEDGHNRVAAALYTGQVAVDANVIELLLPGMKHRPPSQPVAPYLADSIRDVRAAGEGRLTAGSDASDRLRDLLEQTPPHEHSPGAEPEAEA